ncbi:MAG: hypothetical protein EpisKO_23400 [Epibacterium sp.]
MSVFCNGIKDVLFIVKKADPQGAVIRQKKGLAVGEYVGGWVNPSRGAGVGELCEACRVAPTSREVLRGGAGSHPDHVRLALAGGNLSSKSGELGSSHDPETQKHTGNERTWTL